MVTKKKAIEILPPGQLSAEELIPQTPELTELEGYSQLEVRTQDKLRVFKAKWWKHAEQVMRNYSELYMLRKEIKAQRVWGEYVEKHLKLNFKTLSRDMQVQDMLREHLPEDVLGRVLMLPRRITLGQATALRFPPKWTPEAKEEFMQTIENPKSASKRLLAEERAQYMPVDVDKILGTALRNLIGTVLRFTDTPEAAQRLAIDVAEVFLKECGVSSKRSLQPYQLPEKWASEGPGRPTKAKQEEKRRMRELRQSNG